LDLKRKYTPILNEISGEFAEEVPDEHYKLVFGNLSKEVAEAVIQLEGTNPCTSLVWYHLSNIGLTLTTGIKPSEDPENHYLLSEEEFNQLKISTRWLDENFNENTDIIAGVYNEMGISGNKPYTKNTFEPDLPNDSFQNWLQRHQEYVNKHQELFSGENLQSFRRVIEEFQSDYQRIDALLHNTIVNHSPNIKRILEYSTLLLVVGVFLPVSSLIVDVPDRLYFLLPDSDYLFGYEVFLLLTSLTLIILLIDSIATDIGDGSPARKPFNIIYKSLSIARERIGKKTYGFIFSLFMEEGGDRE
jgi:hypothetical protein